MPRLPRTNNGPAKLSRNSRNRARPQDVDRHVGRRIRERRIMLGMTLDHLADMIGITFQQAHKYEKGVNRIAASRLYGAAKALGVDVAYFFDGLDHAPVFHPTERQRLLLELARSVVAVSNPRHQEAICSFARTLANRPKQDDESEALGKTGTEALAFAGSATSTAAGPTR